MTALATSPRTPFAPGAAPALLLPFPGAGGGPAQRSLIPRGGLVLGLGAAVFEAPFADPCMAPRHAEVRLQGAGAEIQDLGGGARTHVNGASLIGCHSLEEGDVLRLGDTMLLYTRMELDPATGAERSGAEPELIGATASMVALRRSIEAVAPHSRTVVVVGETGTGKEIVARTLHRHSGRSGPFLAVNCGGFTEGLLASELFGHVRGAFTGAVSEQQGLFRAAHGGTLLLDEVGDIPLALQPALLRVLEAWEVRPVGSARNLPVDVRVVAASNRELGALVQQGLFRADLYGRMAQWIIRTPPLREHREDIPALVRTLLARLGAGARLLTPDLEEALLLHPWPLNVRGLSNVLCIASIATPAAEPLGLGPEVREALRDNDLDRAVPPAEPPAIELDRVHLEELLRRFGGRVAESARSAGVSRPRLYRLLWAAGLDPAEYRRP
jgi:DNA-binding NtrC family response regulator